MKLNDAGKMIRENWEKISIRFKSIDIDEYIIMPNHLHGILIIQDNVGAPLVGAHMDTQNVTNNITPPIMILGTGINNLDNEIHSDMNGAGTRPAPTKMGIADIIGAFKSITTNKYIGGVRNHYWPSFNKRLWQRNYYEHFIRDRDEYNRIKKYIIENPSKWNIDNKNPITPRPFK